ncbi:MAG TPA: transglycosylase SLT domain-containing protein [Vicinamibacteria bacterium]|nr:transglycosylase SLT domain-containing protein [Vicinamibacteria bacterium]
MRRLISLACAALFAAGCAHGRASVRRAAPADEAAQRLSEARARFDAGTNELREGHLSAARTQFDRAVDLFLTAPGGAYSDPRLAEGYRRMLEAIHVQEMEALSAGDGFTAARAEPAAIDDLADLSLPEGSASAEARRTAEEILRENMGDFRLELNDEVLSCVDLYQGPLRDWFESALGRGARYLPRIRQVFASVGIPQDLAYVALVESAFKPSALSHASAKGMWQFIPETGRRYGLDQDWWVDERSDPEKATQAAARYLKSLYGIFGDWNLALAAYNAGEGSVGRALGQVGAGGGFWQLARDGYLVRETRNYVPMIHAAILMARAPSRYGFSVAPEEPAGADVVTVKGAVDLRVVAECSRTGVGSIQQLNPELRRLATPAHRSYGLKVPRGSGDSVRQCLESIPPERRVAFRTHVVTRGETLAALARRYGSRAQAIVDANGLSPKARLLKGAELIIPIDAPAAGPSAAPLRADAAARGGDEDASRDRRAIRYRVQPGDTLTRIASRYGTSVDRLRSWNGIRGTYLAAGETLKIYAPSSETARRTRPGRSPS